jgi:hypothetical protein
MRGTMMKPERDSIRATNLVKPRGTISPYPRVEKVRPGHRKFFPKKPSLPVHSVF